MDERGAEDEAASGVIDGSRSQEAGILRGRGEGRSEARPSERNVEDGPGGGAPDHRGPERASERGPQNRGWMNGAIAELWAKIGIAPSSKSIGDIKPRLGHGRPGASSAPPSFALVAVSLRFATRVTLTCYCYTAQHFPSPRSPSTRAYSSVPPAIHDLAPLSPARPSGRSHGSPRSKDFIIQALMEDVSLFHAESATRPNRPIPRTPSCQRVGEGSSSW